MRATDRSLRNSINEKNAGTRALYVLGRKTGKYALLEIKLFGWRIRARNKNWELPFIWGYYTAIRFAKFVCRKSGMPETKFTISEIRWNIDMGFKNFYETLQLQNFCCRSVLNFCFVLKIKMIICTIEFFFYDPQLFRIYVQV